MEWEIIRKLGLSLDTLESKVGIFEEHHDAEVSLESRQKLLTDDICVVYDNWAVYETEKRRALDTVPTTEKDLLIQDKIQSDIVPRENSIMRRFETLRERACKYILEDVHKKQINDYIEKRHANLLEWHGYSNQREEAESG